MEPQTGQTSFFFFFSIVCCWAANLSSYVEPSCGFVAKKTTTSSIQVSLWWCWIPLLVSNHHHNPCPYLFPCKSDQRHHSLLILPVYSSWIPQSVLLLFPPRVPSSIFSSDQNQIGLDRSSSSSTTLFWLCCITTLLSPFSSVGSPIDSIMFKLQTRLGPKNNKVTVTDGCLGKATR